MQHHFIQRRLLDFRTSLLDREVVDASVIRLLAAAAMAVARPMDRLLCGDVGFGKTEVALRAAFKAIQSGKQVALLVPTTLLAQQHFSTIEERFAPYPMTVAALSRLTVLEDTDSTNAELSRLPAAERHGHAVLAVVVTLSMVVAIVASALMGVLVPYFFRLVRIDPAIAAECPGR